jgi:hypothetical protein
LFAVGAPSVDGREAARRCAPVVKASARLFVPRILCAPQA